ncbi:MAG: hypothetical protein KC613_27305, partial [Myxococcales bacterium]|nr:hypothetical protein [Myxococcales bacterium]
MSARAPCPPPEALEAAWPDAGPGLKDHLQGCRACATEWAQIGALARLAADLPAGAPSGIRADAVRDAVLAGALTGPHRAVRPTGAPRWL